jgi:hypothetical protein
MKNSRKMQMQNIFKRADNNKKLAQRYVKIP